jgi:hypothetical protein
LLQKKEGGETGTVKLLLSKERGLGPKSKKKEEGFAKKKRENWICETLLSSRIGRDKDLVFYLN